MLISPTVSSFMRQPACAIDPRRWVVAFVAPWIVSARAESAASPLGRGRRCCGGPLPTTPAGVDFGDYKSETLTTKAWKALEAKDYPAVLALHEGMHQAVWRRGLER